MASVRSIVERLSRGRSFWRRLPAPFESARILVSPDAALAVLKRGAAWVDESLLTTVTSFVKRGDTVWDIGGNLGIFSVAASVRCGPEGAVLCVEPDIFLAGLIRRSAARRSDAMATISVLTAAVAKEFGIAKFNISARGRASNALELFGRGQMGSTRETHLVPVVSLDALLSVSQTPAVVKIDVEGAEAEILLGASKVLNVARPVMHIEVGDESADISTQELLRANYLLFSASKPVSQQQPLSRCVWDTLAIPAEKLEAALS